MTIHPGSVRAKTQRRHDRMLELVNQDITDVEALAVALGVSPSTVRRDLTFLQQRGAIARTYGGAIALIPRLAEPTFTASLGVAVQEKEAIAQLAIEQIRHGDSLFIDAGTTCLALAKSLIGLGRRRVVTRGLETAVILRNDPDIEVIVVGGYVHPASHGVVGAMALHTLERVYVDIAVLGADVVDPELGLGEPTLEEIAVKELAVRHSARQLLLVDHHKFEPHTTNAWMPLDGHCTVITDHLVREHTLSEWRMTHEVLQTKSPGSPRKA
ncbi:DeoR/GlpR family DNA-binding transcription regulator [Stomatohabitans albus]|uniref:DeoR/GlpR family DNA-binding transcription regulator n=1 Tax=Stomatohabitans albus TaxID=3110766 RepID=UPI00300C7764